jgi:hypothetical protein
MRVGGSEKSEGIPEHKNTRTTRFNVQFTKDRETRNLQKTPLASKVVNLFTRARAPPFYGEMKGLFTFREYCDNPT